MSAASAYIYTRVSTDEQAEEGYSLGAQERAGRLYAELHGLAVAGVFSDEGLSGKRADRPAFRRLLEAARPGGVIIVHKLDRFARNTALLLATVEELNQRGVKLVSISEQLDCSSPSGKMLLTMLASFGQYYVDNLSQETAKGLTEKARRGLWVGPVPFGYRKVSEADKGALEPSEEAWVVSEIFRLFVDEGLSYDRIVNELNRRGLRTWNWRDKVWREWSREAVRTIIRNRAYIGKVSSGGQEYDGAHAPLVSVETWERAAQRRDHQVKRSAPRPETRRPRQKYGKVLFCAYCGGKLWFKVGGRSDTPSYVCGNRWRGRCEGQQATAAHIEAQIDKILRLIVVPSEAYQSAIERVLIADGEVKEVIAKEEYRDLFAVLFAAPAR